MQSRDHREDQNCDDRIPITEWPMDSNYKDYQASALGANSSNFDSLEQYTQDDKLHHTVTAGTLPGIQVAKPAFKRRQIRAFEDVPSKYPREVTEEYLEPMAAVRVAKWWRKRIHLHANQEVSSVNPNTRLYHISRTKECQEFLEDEKQHLKRILSETSTTGRASAYAALASIYDWLDCHDSAMENIAMAVTLSASNSEFLWLKEKLTRQLKALQTQKEMMEKWKKESSVLGEFPPVEKVERISCRNLSVQDFKDRYVKRGKPVILEDVASSMTEQTWDLDYIKKVAGCITTPVKKNVPGSVEWARLEESRKVTVADHIDEVKEGNTTDYLFDWSLPLHCTHLANEITLPKYFSDNFLIKTNPGSLYHDSWPSLFVAPAGVTSDLHVDAFASSFWMALFHGEKRWTFFDANDLALLYPKYLQSLDPVFNVNVAEPDLKSFPLLALTKPKQCVLKPGDLLFVPAGSPHFVENLTASVAVSSNYVDASNYQQVCEELRISGLLDPRAKQLLEQLESSDFKARMMHEDT